MDRNVSTQGTERGCSTRNAKLRRIIREHHHRARMVRRLDRWRIRQLHTSDLRQKIRCRSSQTLHSLRKRLVRNNGRHIRTNEAARFQAPPKDYDRTSRLVTLTTHPTYYHFHKVSRLSLSGCHDNPCISSPNSPTLHPINT